VALHFLEIGQVARDPWQMLHHYLCTLQTLQMEAEHMGCLKLHNAPSAETTLEAALQDMPSDLQKSAPLIPPPEGPPGTKAFLQDFGEKAIQKELPPEVTGQEECLILD